MPCWRSTQYPSVSGPPSMEMLNVPEYAPFSVPPPHAAPIVPSTVRCIAGGPPKFGSRQAVAPNAFPDGRMHVAQAIAPATIVRFHDRYDLLPIRHLALFELVSPCDLERLRGAPLAGNTSIGRHPHTPRVAIPARPHRGRRVQTGTDN